MLLINSVPIEKILGITINLGDLGTMPKIYLVPTFFVYSAIALVFSKIKKHLNLGRKAAFITIFSFLFTISVLLPNIEGNFYLSNYPLTFNLIYGFVLTLLITISILYLWKQNDNPTGINQQIKSFFSLCNILIVFSC